MKPFPKLDLFVLVLNVLEYIFENVHASNLIPFIKFKNFIKNEFYKIDKNLIFNIDKIPEVKKNFSNYDQYFLNYKNIKYHIDYSYTDFEILGSPQKLTITFVLR